MASQATRSKVAQGPLGGIGLGMVASDRITGAIGATGWLLDGDGRPGSAAGSHGLSFPTRGPRRALASRRAYATPQRMGGLLWPIGHALGGQRLAWVQMLVVHGSLLLSSWAVMKGWRIW